MDAKQKILREATRRQFFKSCGVGVGKIALASLLSDDLHAAAAPGNPLAVKPPHATPRAKSVIFLHMSGSPSQLDLFDHKPLLNKHNMEPVPEEFIKGERFAFIKGVPNLLGSPYKFARHGRSGAELSELLPHLAGVVDEIAIVKSMHTDQFNHAPAQIFMNTGSPIIGRPSMGSWLTYGLGSESADLPGFIVMVSGNHDPSGGHACWSNGFLPSSYQGVKFLSRGDPVPFSSNPAGMSDARRRQSLDALAELNRMRMSRLGDPEIAARIDQYELAYRMQSSVPDLMDIATEPDSIREMYGAEPGESSFANNCLLARRMVERGVRFIQLYDWGWDSHGTSPGDDIVTSLQKQCRRTDQPIAALIRDLRGRGLLDETLIVWGGEFGRTPMNEARNGSKFLGRDHHPHCFTMWMAGGGVKPGITLGATDELGYNITEDPVHVHDLQATILYLMGIDHERLTYRFQGRDFRLTDVFGNVVHKLLA